jgi:hypothetical protein
VQLTHIDAGLIHSARSLHSTARLMKVGPQQLDVRKVWYQAGCTSLAAQTATAFAQTWQHKLQNGRWRLFVFAPSPRPPDGLGHVQRAMAPQALFIWPFGQATDVALEFESVRVHTHDNCIAGLTVRRSHFSGPSMATDVSPGQ